jgi:hypothetical protein
MTPQRWALVALASVLLLVGAFSAGRFSAPLKVETRDVEKVVYQDRVVEKVVTVETKAKAETKVVYRDRVVTKDGTVTERVVERTDTKEDTKADTMAAADTSHTIVTEKENTAKTTLRPDWRVGVLFGASLAKPLVPISGPLVVGVQAEHRITGGLSAGLWANSVGAAGLVVSVEF